MRNTDPRRPIIYAFTTPDRPGLLKVGETSRDVDVRIREILRHAVPDPTDYTVITCYPAVTPDGLLITDHAVHHTLEHTLGRHRFPRTEWFICEPADVTAAIRIVEREMRSTEHSPATANYPHSPRPLRIPLPLRAARRPSLAAFR